MAENISVLQSNNDDTQVAHIQQLVHSHKRNIVIGLLDQGDTSNSGVTNAKPPENHSISTTEVAQINTDEEGFNRV